MTGGPHKGGAGASAQAACEDIHLLTRLSLCMTTTRSMTFERHVIQKWLKKCNTSPVTNLPLPDLELRPNRALRNAIEEWIAHENRRAQEASLNLFVDEPKQAKTGQEDRCILHDHGWRLLAARAGVLAFSVLIFDSLRESAEKMLTVLVKDAVDLCAHDCRTTVLATDILRAAIKCHDNHNPKQNS